MPIKKIGVIIALILFVYFVIPAKAGIHNRRSTIVDFRSRSGMTLSERSVKTTARNNDWHTVTRVIDGDTIEIETGERVRYIGMNTPETVDPRKPIECFGKEASAYNHQLVEGRKIRLVSDVTDKDKYGRLLRYVYLEDGTFINLKLVEDGYASVMTIPPNVSKSEEFRVAEHEAREAGRGLWQACQ